MEDRYVREIESSVDLVHDQETFRAMDRGAL